MMATPLLDSGLLGGRQDLTDIDLFCRIRGEYLEMPGMNLTLDQAARLWTLDKPTCFRVLTQLVRQGFLECDHAGHYLLAQTGLDEGLAP